MSWTKKIRPQPPKETFRIEQIENTDSFDCYSETGEFLACINSRIPDIIAVKNTDGKWYWKAND